MNTQDSKTSSKQDQPFANEVTLIGTLYQEPTLRYTGKGLAVLSGSIGYKLPQSKSSIFESGRKFRNFVAFGADAEQIAETLTKVMRVQLSGELQTRSYDVEQSDPETGEQLYVQNGEGKLVLPRRKSSSVVITPAGVEVEAGVAEDTNRARIKGIARNIRYNAGAGVANFTIEGESEKAEGGVAKSFTEITAWNREGDNLATRVGEQLEDGMMVTVLGYVSDNTYDDPKTGIRHYTYRVTGSKVYAARPKAEAAKTTSLFDVPEMKPKTEQLAKVMPASVAAPAMASASAF